MSDMFTPELLPVFILSFLGGSISAFTITWLWARGYIKRTVSIQVEHYLKDHPSLLDTDLNPMDIIDPSALEQASSSLNHYKSENTDRAHDETHIDTHTDLNHEADKVRATFKSMKLPSIDQPITSPSPPSNSQQEDTTVRTQKTVSSVDSLHSISQEDGESISDPLPYPVELPTEDTEEDATVLMHRKPPKS